MKYIITENQYKILLREDRVEFLKNQNVIDPKVLDQSVEGEEEATGKRKPGGMNPNKPKIEPIEDHNGVDIAYIITKKGKQSIKLAEQTFNDIVEADPSNNKQYVQWMIQVFMRHINDGDIEQSVRFLSEDLPEANEYLSVFDSVKNKKIFKRSAPNRPNAPQNVTDINQYTDLSHLYSVVSPFIGAEDDESEEGSESPLWKKLKKYIDLGEAKLTYRDNDILIYTPLTRDASCEPLGPLASWCTRRPENTHFDSYRRNHLKPDGSLSDYYVIMPKPLFSGDDGGDMYPLQFHFESNQIHDKGNKSIEGPKLNNFLSKYTGVANFFRKELGALVEMDVRRGAGLMNSSYIKYLNMFGGKAQDFISGEAYEEGVRNIKKLASEQNVALQNNKYLIWLMENTEGVNIIEFLDPDSTTILDFSGLKLNELPNMSNFYKLETIMANNCGLEKMPPIEYLPLDSPLSVMTFTGNKISEAPPKGYEKLKNLFSMSLKQNPIKKINVETLDLLVDSDFMRFATDSDVLKNLTPQNLSQMEEFLSGKGLGMMVTG